MASYHNQLPASIPSDYALLSRYANSQNQNQNVVEDEEVIEDGDETETESEETLLQGSHQRQRRRQKRRSSTGRRLSRYSYTDLHPDQAIERVPAPRPAPTESTPLLNPYVPRIVENVDIEYTRDYPNGPIPGPSTSQHEHTHDDAESCVSVAESIGSEMYNEESTSTLNIFKSELWILTKYALPVYGTHLLEFSLVMASVLSIGHLSTTALAAITLGSMTANVTALSVIQGFISALDTLLPAAWTSSQPELVGLWSQRMGVVLAFALVPMYLVWWNAEVILVGLKQDLEVARLAGTYLRWLSLGLPAYAFNGVSRRYFQAQGRFTVPTRIIFIAAPVNAVLNYILVWGPGRLEVFRLGFIGAPLATAISFNLVSLMSLGYGIWIERDIRRRQKEILEALQNSEDSEDLRSEEGDANGRGSSRPSGYGATADSNEHGNQNRNSLNRDSDVAVTKKIQLPKSAWYPFSLRSFTSLGPLVELGLGGVGQTASEWWAWELIGLAAALLGPTFLAAQSVLLVSASATYQAPFALGVGCSVRIGNLLGERHARRAQVTAYTSIFMGLLISLFFSLMFLLSKDSWSYIFNSDPEVAQIVSHILPLVALFQVFDGNAAITAGILRARGKQILGALLNLSAYYVIGIPLGIALAFKWGMGLTGLWIGLTVSLVYCAVAGTGVCVRTDWEREVGKVRERLRGDMRRAGKE
ncbi:MATE efflux family protein [Dendrothele bispora CBS 962.96]|uniref:MATE efflux family protein n=1 Tax=Dendrothele bispora (strain CBS 962.96) TaxID=1314807 RepID=A0A4S8MVD2_DENBC|nr:MATE efflux family protein [Dendrothele bispora CBS 962.96]